MNDQIFLSDLDKVSEEFKHIDSQDWEEYLMEYRWHIFLANLNPVIGHEQALTQ